MLHITNGDCVNEILEQCGLDGELLAYDDVLHEGPASFTNDAAQWRKMRAEFHSNCGWGKYKSCLERLEKKDKVLESAAEHDEIVLWFEHDIYDQLIIIQVLFRLSEIFKTKNKAAKISLICIGEFPGITEFIGLGQLAPEQLSSLFPDRVRITEETLAQGAEAWEAYCSETPLTIYNFNEKYNITRLPFLKDAFKRHLEQFPDSESGLSRTEMQILKTIAAGGRKPVEIFFEEQKFEEKIFMGDTTFCLYLYNLYNCESPLIDVINRDDMVLPHNAANRGEFINQEIVITNAGLMILAKKEDNIRMNGIDIWRGGVHLLGKENIWRWNKQNKILEKK